MYAFEYVRPASIDEAVKALQAEDAQALAGGQTLIPTLKQRLAQPSVLVDLGACVDRGVQASGGGCEIGWACDLRVAEEGVLFSQPEVRIGVGTGLGGTSRLVRIVGRTIAAEMVLDGLPLTAERLYEIGAVNRVVAKGKSVETAVEWAKRLAGHPPDALSGMKRMLNEAQEMTLQESVLNDQKIFQEFSGSLHAIRKMEEIQDKFDKGAGIRETYWPDLEKSG